MAGRLACSLLYWRPYSSCVLLLPYPASSVSKSTLTFSGSQDSAWVNRDLIEFRFYKHKKAGGIFWNLEAFYKKTSAMTHFFIASINNLLELWGNVLEKSKNSTGKHFQFRSYVLFLTLQKIHRNHPVCQTLQSKKKEKRKEKAGITCLLDAKRRV